MQVRYVIEYALRLDPQDGHHYYAPIGVWAQGPGLGLDIVMQYLPGNEDAQAIADGILNDLVERGIRALPEDFLGQWQGRISFYRGDRSPVYVTDARSTEAVAAILIERMATEKSLGDPPLP